MADDDGPQQLSRKKFGKRGGYFFSGKRTANGASDCSGFKMNPDKPDAELPEWERCGNLHALPFHEIARRFERAESVNGNDARIDIIFDDFIVGTIGAQSSYPIVRLLLVSSDNGRRNFGVKIKILSNIYLKLAHLKDAPMTNEAARTLKYFAGDLEARDRCVGGDFGGNLSDVLKSRLNIERGSLTLGEVHAFLDGVALHRKKIHALFEDVYHKLSPVEHKWLARVILGDLKLRLKERPVFWMLHPDAMERYAACSSLRTTCGDFALRGPGRLKATGRRGSLPPCDVDPGQPFQVMLAHGDAQTDDQVASAISHIAKAARQHGLAEGGGAPGLLADLKLDGERLVVHKNGADVSFWTRNCSNYTSTYGVTGLGEEIRAMCDGLDRCVVDGEVVSLNLRTQTFANFGTNQKVAQYERALIDARKKRGAEDPYEDDTADDEEIVDAVLEAVANDEGEMPHGLDRRDLAAVRLVYVVFDVLHVSGRAAREILGAGADGAPVPEGGVGELPLRTRRAILERLCERAKPGRERTDGTRVPRRIQLVRSKVIDDPRLSTEQRKDQLLKYYARVVEIGGEGVIVKALDAPYCIGRFTKKLKLWVKLKPEYGNEGEVPRLDCVIVGGYWSEAMRHGRRGQLSQFVVALRKSAGADEDGAYYTFGRIGTGYRVQQLTEINEQLKDNLVGYDPSDLPPYFHPGWDPRGEEKPDKIVRDVSKSVVLEIKCGELVKSDQFSVPCTFRFPRVERIRHDKGAADIDVVQQAKDIFARPRQVITVGGGRGRKQKKGGKRPRVPVGVRSDARVDRTALGKIAAESDKTKIFDGAVFVVLPAARAPPPPVELDAEDPDAWTGELNYAALRTKLAERGADVLAHIPNFDPDDGAATSYYVLGARGRDGTQLNGYARKRRVRVLDATWAAQSMAADELLDPRPRDFLARPSDDDVARLKRDFEPVWGNRVRGEITAGDLALDVAHARDARKRGGDWFFDELTEPVDVDAVLATAGLRLSCRALKGAVVLLTPYTCGLHSRIRIYGGAHLEPGADAAAATHVLAEAEEDVPEGPDRVDRHWLAKCIEARELLPSFYFKLEDDAMDDAAFE